MLWWRSIGLGRVGLWKKTRRDNIGRRVLPMVDSSFIGYVGEPDFHDGSILTVERKDSCARVRVQGASGKVFIVEFRGVRAVKANQPEGMVLYALSELRGDPPLRRFVFANWDDDGKSYLEVEAENFVFHE